MVLIPKQFEERIKELKEQLDLAIMYNDIKRINYLQHQIKMFDERIKTRKEVYER